MWSCVVMQPVVLVSTSDTGVMSSSRSGVNLAVGGGRGLGDPARQRGARLCLVVVPGTEAFPACSRGVSAQDTVKADPGPRTRPP